MNSKSKTADSGPPSFSPRQQARATAVLRRAGWRLNVAPQAYQHPRYVLFGAYHTTNWDGVLSVLGLMAANIRASIMIKREWVEHPLLGSLVRSFGGVAVDRSAAQDTVTQLANEFARREQFVLAITPEGTRARRDYWKTGFYHIAAAARVPLLLGYLDYPSRTFGITATVVWPTGDLEKDMQAFAPALAQIRPKFPEQAGEMRFPSRP